MPSNTKLLQAMADTMLPLFGDMPRVVVLVKDHASFHQEVPPLAVYDAPNIVVHPDHPPTSSFDNLKSTICHELIHAWLDWTGLDQAGEFLDQHHNEWFVKKALEINRMSLDGLEVHLEFLLTTPEGMRIYNRVAGTSRFPRRLATKEEIEAISQTTKESAVTVEIKKRDRTGIFLIICFLLMLTTIYFKNAVTGYVWISCTVVAFLWLGYETWTEISRRRLSGKSLSLKKAKGAPATEVVKRPEE